MIINKCTILVNQKCPPVMKRNGIDFLKIITQMGYSKISSDSSTEHELCNMIVFVVVT